MDLQEAQRLLSKSPPLLFCRGLRRSGVYNGSVRCGLCGRVEIGLFKAFIEHREIKVERPFFGGRNGGRKCSAGKNERVSILKLYWLRPC